MQTKKSILVYDGNCSFCTRLAKSIREKTNDKIAIVSYHQLSKAELEFLHKQLTNELCAGEVQFIEEGNRYPGFFAVRQILWKMDKYKYLAILLYLPLIPFLGMATMFLLKRFRSKL
ncbi:PF04134 family protein [Leptospira wolbachii serovar Codice str. CDC]|uniref:PF04134 family protein n=1 Tax=Leptospira wolbachii serovar Codice str. CDC TaxID=1218599 RepID=R9A710_9LEPT|nr:DCC1-like thiol-disulfide oxidoreductase family protein [Leptospira wolbachii]EOQ97892.1 PF04134 family protein [Leptospira wolbachii serovar Codice str. CDC]